ISLNINTINVVHILWTDDAVRALIAESAQAYAEKNKDVLQSVPQNETGPGFAEAIKGFSDQLESLKLPIGWQEWPTIADLDKMAASQIALAIAGWLITALAVSLGAHFWFQILGDLLKLRGTGPKPK